MLYLHDLGGPGFRSFCMLIPQYCSVFSMQVVWTDLHLACVKAIQLEALFSAALLLADLHRNPYKPFEANPFQASDRDAEARVGVACFGCASGMFNVVTGFDISKHRRWHVSKIATKLFAPSSQSSEDAKAGCC